MPTRSTSSSNRQNIAEGKLVDEENSSRTCLGKPRTNKPATQHLHGKLSGSTLWADPQRVSLDFSHPEDVCC